MRRSLVALAVALGSVGGALLFRRRRANRHDRVVVHFADGSMVTLEHTAPEAEPLLAVARDALRGRG